jgi:hypothetical protein
MSYISASGLRKFFKRRRVVKCFALFAVYMFFENNIRLEERAQELQSHRSLERELFTKLNDDGTCDIGSPTQDANPAGDSTKTLLASYPGSGKVCVLALLCSENPISFTSKALLTFHCFL